MTKTLINKLRVIFFKCTDSWENNILVSASIDPDNFEFKIVKFVVSMLWWSPRMTLRVNKTNCFYRFVCNIFKTNIKLLVTWLYSVVRVIWTIINWSHWIYIEQLGKRHKIIPIPWACTVFPLSNFKMALVGKNI